ncbi:sigma-70 family RNA polymerase sigma factor [Rhodococcus sp. IEGM 1305]|nr:sigma-70 family RNA polymerase sigma factor [Rhodococcus sp. IEGM 1305]MDI9950015.1 sigma-70 family RNA polymerase sigma factor [Rhodococcus sp. IEGM 1305]
MNDDEVLAHRFEESRTHLSAVAYRMLGSISEAEDAVQEGWLRLSRAETSDVENLRGWLTTVVARVCLDMLRSRKMRSEEPLDVHVPDPIVSELDGADPEHEAVLGDSVGLALLVVLDTLTPAERLAFVLHDMFALSFDEIAPIAGRTPAASRQLASRARRRVQGSGPVPDADLTRQREIVEAFMAASRGGRFDDLLALLDPDIVLRADGGADGSSLVRGARAVSEQALTFARFAPFARLALVNGAAGVVTAPEGKAMSVMAFTVSGGKIARIDILADPHRLQVLGLSSAGDRRPRR